MSGALERVTRATGARRAGGRGPWLYEAAAVTRDRRGKSPLGQVKKWRARDRHTGIDRSEGDPNGPGGRGWRGALPARPSEEGTMTVDDIVYAIYERLCIRQRPGGSAWT
jgi:hypothetical protein